MCFLRLCCMCAEVMCGISVMEFNPLGMTDLRKHERRDSSSLDSDVEVAINVM
jgi:hypothetical protein